jgi:hypothetical protein
MGGGIAHHAAFAHTLFAHFKLRLHEQQGFAPIGLQQSANRWQH